MQSTGIILKRMVPAPALALLLIGTLALALTFYLSKQPKAKVVPDDFPTIQEAVNAAGPGDTVFVKAGIYHEHVVVNKSLSLIGESRSTTIIDGNGTGTVVVFDAVYNTTAIVNVVANDVNISGFTIRNGGFHGIALTQTVNCTVDNITSLNSTSCISLMNTNRNHISNSKFSNGTWGIFLFNSTENEIVGNEVSENWHAGIAVGGPEGSSENLIANNTVTHNVKPGYSQFGHGLDVFGSDNKILQNNISSNNNGIILDMAHRNQLKENVISNNTYFGIRLFRDSSNNTFFGNTIQQSGLAGLLLDYGTNNLIHHNNFVNNNPQVSFAFHGAVWDDGVEGNYWSDYAGEDNNRDGLGDTAYMVYEHYRDNHPLMGMFSGFNTSLHYQVHVISNSTIEDLEYFESTHTITMHISNMTVNQAYGFCRIRIPHALMNETYRVTVDGKEPYYVNYTLYADGTNRWIYFAYQHPTHEIIIQGFSPAETSPTLTLLAIVIIAGAGAALLLYTLKSRKVGQS